MKMKYRIKEHYNKFYPQAEISVQVSTNFWGTKHETQKKWVNMDEYTHTPIEEYIYSRDRGCHQKDVVCKTLEEARLYIRSLDRGVIYHDVYDGM